MTTPEDEIARLKAQLAERDAALAERDTALAVREAQLAKQEAARKKAEAQVETLTAKVRTLEFELGLLRKQLFGKSSEKVDPAQLKLAFDEAVEEANAAAPPLDDEPFPGDLLEDLAQAEREDEDRPQLKGKRRRRKPSFPEDLPVERGEEIHPAELSCSCGCEKVRMGEEVTRRLARRPAAFFWKETVRVKYLCPGCSEITRPPLPPAPIEKGLADTSLLVDVLLDKFLDHLPLTRLSAIYQRQGVELPKTTLWSWIQAVTDEPLLGAIAEAVGQSVCARPCQGPGKLTALGSPKLTAS